MLVISLTKFGIAPLIIVFICAGVRPYFFTSSADT